MGKGENYLDEEKVIMNKERIRSDNDLRSEGATVTPEGVITSATDEQIDTAINEKDVEKLNKEKNREMMENTGELLIKKISFQLVNFINSNRDPEREESVNKRFKTGNIDISLQASSQHLCEPKENNADYYKKVEFACRDREVPEYLKGYYSSGDEAYIYVPIELVARWVAEEGDMGFSEKIEKEEEE